MDLHLVWISTFLDQPCIATNFLFYSAICLNFDLEFLCAVVLLSSICVYFWKPNRDMFFFHFSLFWPMNWHKFLIEQQQQQQAKTCQDRTIVKSSLSSSLSTMLGHEVKIMGKPISSFFSNLWIVSQLDRD